MSLFPVVTPPAKFPERAADAAATSNVCLYWRDSGSSLASFVCPDNQQCIQETTVTPAIAYCEDDDAVTRCFNPGKGPSGGCDIDQLCCTGRNTCASYEINTGKVLMNVCATSKITVTGINPSFIGYNVALAAATGSPTMASSHTATASSSSSSGSDSGDIGIAVGVIIGCVVLVALLVWFFWWLFCLRRNSSWWNTRKGKYTQIQDSGNPSTNAGPGGLLQAGAVGYSAPSGAYSNQVGVGGYANQGTGYSSVAGGYSGPVVSYGPAGGGYAVQSGGYEMGPVDAASAATSTQNAAPASGRPTSLTSGHSVNTPSVPTTGTSPQPAGVVEWGQSDPGRTLTYRVEFVPNNFLKEDVRNRLFSLPDRFRVTVRSLAPSVSGNKQVATIEYHSMTRNSSGPSLSSEARELHIPPPDRAFQGWTPLNYPNDPIRADIVAVTGLAGHAFGSWSVDQHQMWIRDFLPSEIPNIRTITYGYNSQLTETMSRQDFDQHAEDFAEGLQALWKSTFYQRPTIFIGHSLGCLIIKQALILSRGWKGRPDKLENIVPLLIFMGAPHNGLANDALMTLVKGKASESLIEELGPGSPTLNNLKFKFDDIAQNVKVLSIFERRKTKTAIEKNGKWVREGPPVMMVEKQNAVTYLPLETRISSDTDHREISRLTHTDGSIYGPIKRAICNALEMPSEGFSGGFFPQQ